MSTDFLITQLNAFILATRKHCFEPSESTRQPGLFTPNRDLGNNKSQRIAATIEAEFQKQLKDARIKGGKAGYEKVSVSGAN